MIVETTIEIDNYYRIPISKKEWEVRKKTRKFNYRMRNVN